ncbi:MAG: 7-cyano-7-deazaguanine synthase [Pirellulaceae bacterium]
MRETFVPNRNAMFAAIAYSWALSLAAKHKTDVSLALGVHSGDHAIYPDCRPEFYEQLMKAFAMGNWDSERVQIELPYLHSDKFQILKDAQESIQNLKLDFATVFSNTVTSYSPDHDETASGLTGSDVERILAFHALGIPDPIRYRKSWEDVVKDALLQEQQFRAQSNN